MKKYAVIALAVLIIGYILILNFSNLFTYTDKKIKISEYKEKEDAVLSFIKEHFLGKNGEVFTNLTSAREAKSTLSESVGLLMEYSVLRDKRDLFDLEYSLLMNDMITENGYIKWRMGEEKANCNAAIDDLRILRALMDAYYKWNCSDYLDAAEIIQAGIYKKQVEEDTLYEFYDWNSDSKRKQMPLCYLDLNTLDRLSIFERRWSNVADKGLELINKGRISSASPFFNKYYSYEKKKYLKDEEYSKNKSICLTYSVYTAIHLAEQSENTEYFTNWLKSEIEKGKIYAWYNPDTLKPVNGFESTAVYALCAIYSKKVGENELYRKMIGRMLNFMVTNAKSSYYGGLGIEASREFYSFDNLTALLALALADDISLP